MKTTLDWLNEQKEMAYHTLLCYSKTYAMDTPKDGMDQAFAEALRDVEILEELVSLAKQPNTSNCTCSSKGCDWEKIRKEIEIEIDEEINCDIVKYGTTREELQNAMKLRKSK